MGLLDFFEDVRDKVSDVAFNASMTVESAMCEISSQAELAVDSEKELCGIFAEGKRDLEDITLSTFKDGIPECASEIRADAEKIISKSKRKYEKKYKSVQEKLEILENERRSLYEEKKKIARMMNMGHHCSVSIPAEIPAVRLGEPKTAEPDSIFMELFLIPGTPPVLKSILAYERADKRLTEARGYLEDAKDFEIEIAKEKAKLKELECFAEKIIGIFAEEREVLQTLKKSLAMDRPEESREAVKSLEILLAESILDRDGRTNKKYEAAVYGIKNLFKAEGGD